MYISKIYKLNSAHNTVYLHYYDTNTRTYNGTSVPKHRFSDYKLNLGDFYTSTAIPTDESCAFVKLKDVQVFKIRDVKRNIVNIFDDDELLYIQDSRITCPTYRAEQPFLDTQTVKFLFEYSSQDLYLAFYEGVPLCAWDTDFDRPITLYKFVGKSHNGVIKLLAAKPMFYSKTLRNKQDEIVENLADGYYTFYAFPGFAVVTDIDMDVALRVNVTQADNANDVVLSDAGPIEVSDDTCLTVSRKLTEGCFECICYYGVLLYDNNTQTTEDINKLTISKVLDEYFGGTNAVIVEYLYTQYVDSKYSGDIYSFVINSLLKPEFVLKRYAASLSIDYESDMYYSVYASLADEAGSDTPESVALHILANHLIML